MSEWITGRLPERAGRYLCFYHYDGETRNEIGIVNYFVDTKESYWQYQHIGMVVTHWMELPPAPRR